MVKKDMETVIRKAFDTLITADPDSYDLFDAEQVLMDARETHADLCIEILNAMTAEERILIAQALAVAAEVLEEGEDMDDTLEVDGCVLAEEDIAMDPNIFEPEFQGDLKAQIHYAFGFMTADNLDCTDAQADAMAFLRRHYEESPRIFYSTLKLLAFSSQKLACKLFEIDIE